MTAVTEATEVTEVTEVTEATEACVSPGCLAGASPRDRIPRELGLS